MTNTVEKEEAAFFEVDYERVFHKDYFYNFSKSYDSFFKI